MNCLGRISKFVYVWLLTVFLFGLSIMTSYVLVQQEGRSAINIPLLQIAQSVDVNIRAGVGTSEILKAQQIDLSTNLSPFITLYSPDKKVLGSSQHLSGRTLTLPSGVLDHARSRGEARVTWQPTNELRFASITDYLPNFGYVSVSQSLKETEARATRGVWIALYALGIGALSSGCAIWIFSIYRKKGVL